MGMLAERAEHVKTRGYGAGGHLEGTVSWCMKLRSKGPAGVLPVLLTTTPNLCWKLQVCVGSTVWSLTHGLKPDSLRSHLGTLEAKTSSVSVPKFLHL